MAAAASTSLDCEHLRRLALAHDDVVVLQTGFGLGHAFLNAWQTWRRCGAAGRLHFIAIEAEPPSAPSLRAAHRDSACAALAGALADTWPALTPDLHRLGFCTDRVSLLLAVGAARRWLTELQARAHMLVIDRFDSTVDRHEWAPRLFRALARLAAADASLSSLLDAGEIAPAVRSAGFEIATAPDAPVLRARYRPRFRPRGSAPSRCCRPERRAVIVGAGLAGCATAWALAELGWRSSIIDRQAGVATEASGNIAGLFHGTVDPQDGAHARFNRAAALHSQAALGAALGHGQVEGSLRGVLRVQEAGIEVEDMRSRLRRLQLPPGYVQALDAAQASAVAGVALDRAAWFFPGGGWLRPASLARYFLRSAGSLARLQAPASVHSIVWADGEWRLFDTEQRLVAQAATLVLANAIDALRLCGCEQWPVQAVRGQLSLYEQSAPPACSRLTLPQVPLAGHGYVLPEIDGTAVFGASAEAGVTEAEGRLIDHQSNLRRLQRLCPQAAPWPSQRLQRLRAQVGWRCVSVDRLPIIGAAPAVDGAANTAACSDVRHVPRRGGLYLFTALGSRGIGWAALGARVLAAQISATPLPLPRSLSANIDPARFVLRERRRRA